MVGPVVFDDCGTGGRIAGKVSKGLGILVLGEGVDIVGLGSLDAGDGGQVRARIGDRRAVRDPQGHEAAGQLVVRDL